MTAYLEQLTDLVVQHGLCAAVPDAPVRRVNRARCATAMRMIGYTDGTDTIAAILPLDGVLRPSQSVAIAPCADRDTIATHPLRPRARLGRGTATPRTFGGRGLMYERSPFVMLLMLLLIGVLGATVVYAVLARTQFQHQVPRLWQAVHTHRIVTGGLVVYSSVVGIILVMGVTPPLLVFLLALPVLAGGAGGWWELRQDARHATQRILHQGMLTGLLATTLPVLLMVVGEVWLAWQTGWYSADPTRMAVEHPVGWGARWGHLLRWVGSFLGVGIILGVVGALIGQGIAALLGRFQHRGSG